MLITRRTAAAVAAIGLLAVGAVSPSVASAGTETGSADARPWVSGDHTVPVYDLADAITESVDVRTSMDGDQDGVIDTIRVDLTRPDTADGLKVPVVIVASPYFSKNPRSVWETGFLVPRGYAVATVALPGTDFATGCSDVGGDLEVLGTKAVIDWLNGRAKGFYLDGTKAVATTWSTGKAGMIGGSWNGTIANAVASTGVEGLETIVPVAAISSWYDYTRQNGIVHFPGHVAYLHEVVSNFDSPYCRTLTPVLHEASDDATGSSNEWWRERDYRLDASKITASVYVVHGLTDENVKTRQFGEWWDELVEHDVERKLFLHQDGHTDPVGYGTYWSGPLLQWFDHYLQDLDNGVDVETQAIIQREGGGWTQEAVWPPAGTTDQKMRLTKPLGRDAGALTLDGAAAAGPSAKVVRIKQTTPHSADTIVADPTAPRLDRAVFLSNQLTSALRESGTATVTMRVKTDRPVAGFMARVVDYDAGGGAYVVSRTEVDLGHHRSWDEREVLEPGKFYTVTWEINTDERIFAAGHRLGLVITAEQNPIDPYQPLLATIKLKRSSITLPLLGGTADLATVGDLAPISTTSVTPGEPTHDLGEFVREFLDLEPAG